METEQPSCLNAQDGTTTVRLPPWSADFAISLLRPQTLLGTAQTAPSKLVHRQRLTPPFFSSAEVGISANNYEEVKVIPIELIDGE